MIRVWALMGGPCGKYMSAVISTWLDALETHGELTPDQHGYNEAVRAELEAMSTATIDRYLSHHRKT